MKFEEVYPFMKVIVRDWDEMAEEFGVRATGTIDCPYGFNNHVMRETCNKIATVVGIHSPDAFCLLIDGKEYPEEDSYHPSTFRAFTWADLLGMQEDNTQEKGGLRLVN